MLTRDSDLQYLENLKDLLEVNGIPAVIQGRNIARMITSRMIFEPTLWVYVDEQFDDALELMENPDHVVVNPLDIEKVKSLLPDESQRRNNLNAALRQLLIFVGFIIVGIFLLVKILQ